MIDSGKIVAELDAAEAPGVEPVFLDQERAISYAKGRACFRSGEIRVMDSTDNTTGRFIKSTRRFEKIGHGALSANI